MTRTVRAGVVGASGLAGGELLRLLDQHPHLDPVFLGGSASAGRRPAELHPGLRLALGGLTVEPVTPETADALADRLDVVFLATPAPASARLAALLADRVPVVVDLSGAFRIRSPALHRRWYPGVERATDLADRFVYGVPELVGDQLRDASLISLPGCYATSITLALAPLVLGLGLDLDTVIVDGKGGSSGGGLGSATADLHPFRSGAIAPYAPTGHRHAGEVLDFLSRAKPRRVSGATSGAGSEAGTGPGSGSGSIGSLSMSAYGVSTVRGLLTSSYVLTDADVDQRELHRAYLRFYRDHRFVRVRRHTETVIPVPDPQAVLGSNYCDVTVLRDEDEGRIVVLAALDNLVKGAAGQAVQAANLRFGFPEETGLTAQPLVPA
ncbi:N-acetyl-gamma-glutamyl-phosphate reductase [Streptomyces sp. NPDC058417]|uniref:N-acetyl-gamma-glutamyl-phosphate reductase n=1 Tax=unclassified Streptomyces TaxID=2593676 RepID=UPI00364B6B7E